MTQTVCANCGHKLTRKERELGCFLCETCETKWSVRHPGVLGALKRIAADRSDHVNAAKERHNRKLEAARSKLAQD